MLSLPIPGLTAQHARGCRYLGDNRFQTALQVGLGMNIMGGDQFKRQQQGKASADTSGSAASPEPRPAHKPKEVSDLGQTLASVRLQRDIWQRFHSRLHLQSGVAAYAHDGFC